MDLILQSIIKHIQYIFSTVYGWLLGIVVGVWSFIAPERFSFIIVGVCILIDLIWGIAVARKRGEFVLSEAGRETFKKVGIYACSLLPIFMIEQNLHNDNWFIVTRLFCTLAAACELWSTSASMLIIKPNMPFIRIFRVQLRGEMEKKFGKSFTKEFKDDNYG